ncbi:hypothetical protein PCAR4_810091 [Paraburkholderia caribensis]|nr:hypothetical protein PCAR4_810091 [Paraburkholderia caribensis]
MPAAFPPHMRRHAGARLDSLSRARQPGSGPREREGRQKSAAPPFLDRPLSHAENFFPF